MILEGAEAALALAPIAFLAGFIQGLTGFRSAPVSIPLAAFFVPLPFALAVFAVVDFVNGLRLGLENPKNAILGDIARMGPLMIVGSVTRPPSRRWGCSFSVPASPACRAAAARRRSAATGRSSPGSAAASREPSSAR